VRRKKAAIILTLCVIYLAGVGVRFFACGLAQKDGPRYFYIGGDMLEYRYAKAYLSDEGVQPIDAKANYPEGLPVTQGLDLAPFAARSYNFLRLRVPFEEFIGFITPIIFCATVFALYGLGQALGFHDFGALSAAAILAFSMGAVARSCGIELLDENLGLPLLVTGIALIAREGKRSNITHFAGGALIGLSFLAWEGAVAYIASVLVVSWFLFVLGSRNTFLERQFKMPALILFGMGLVVPWVRRVGVFGSLWLRICLVYIAIAWLAHIIRRDKMGRVVMSAALPVAGWMSLRGKMGFLSGKFAVAPYEGWVWWASLRRPAGQEALVIFGMVGVLALVGIFLTIRKIKGDERLFALLLVTLVMGVGYGFWKNMSVYVSVFAALWAGYGLGEWAGRGRLKFLATALLLFVICAEGAKIVVNQEYIAKQREKVAVGALLAWCGKNLDCGDVVLSDPVTSSIVLTYTGRASVNSLTRKGSGMAKLLAYSESLKSEDKLYEFSQRMGADYLIFRRDSKLKPEFLSQLRGRVSPAYVNDKFYVMKVYSREVMGKAEDLLAEADGLIEKGELEAARDRLEEALRLYPNSVRVHSRLGLVYYLLGETEKAREEWRRASYVGEK